MQAAVQPVSLGGLFASESGFFRLSLKGWKQMLEVDTRHLDSRHRINVVFGCDSDFLKQPFAIGT